MENNPGQHETIQETILRKIRANELSMRPRFYFMLNVAAVVIVALLVLLISIFIFNFILFSIRINSHDSLLGFGPRGLAVFLQVFPWPLLLADIALISLLEWLVRKFRVGYKIPVLYLLAGLLITTALSAAVLDRGTDLNDRLLNRADHHELFIVGDFFESARRPMPGSGVCVCTITAITGNTLTVADTRSGTTTELKVILPMSDPRATTSSLTIGDTVIIAGDVDDGTIHAFGVHKIPQGNVMYISR